VEERDVSSAGKTRGVLTHARAYADAHLASRSVRSFAVCVSGRHAFPCASKPLAAARRISPTEMGNIGAISGHTNSHGVELHTYRRLAAPNAWLELRQRTHGGSHMQSWAMSGRHGRALFRMSNLEIYGTPDSRARARPWRSAIRVARSNASLHRLVCDARFNYRILRVFFADDSTRSARHSANSRSNGDLYTKNAFAIRNAFWSFVSRDLIVSGIYRIRGAAVAVCRITAFERNLNGRIGSFEEVWASEI